jgi:hypothetical protein
MYSDTSKIYGDLATIFLTDQYPPPLVPEPEAPDEILDNTTDPSGIKRETLKQAIALKLKTDLEEKQNRKKLFGFIYSRLSTSSITQVQRRIVETVIQDTTMVRSIIWNTFMALQEPLQLWKAIKATHVSAKTLSSRMDRYSAHQSYLALKQGQFESIENYEGRFDAIISVMRAVEVDIPPTELLVTKFIESLNHDYTELKMRINNDEFAGIETGSCGNSVKSVCAGKICS